MIEIIPKIPAYQLFRRFGIPKLLPLNLTVSVTYRCNSRCRTCYIYRRKAREFSLREFERTFRSIGKSPYWVTMSGGEPFLREDIVDICSSLYESCRPKLINIPTNGILYEVIPGKVKEITENAPDAEIIVNLSIDEIGERHDEIRNVSGNFKKVMKTFERLRELDRDNLTLGIHTVISKYNVRNFPRIYSVLSRLKPDSYITEIAEERAELSTVGSGITPSLEEYSEAVDFLSREIGRQDFRGISEITQSFRVQYYELVKKTLREKRQVIPCYAGFASAQISPDGDVWACCIKAESMGNLRDVDYDFREVWFSERAWQVREKIKKGACFCPLANASYTNMLVSYRMAAGVAWRILRKRVGRVLGAS